MSEQTWTTIDGRVSKFKDLSDEHLSNIYWYSSFIVRNINLRIRVLNELAERYPEKLTPSEALLPYVPKYESEINILRDKGMIVGNTIYDNDHIIGVLLDEYELASEQYQIAKQELYIKREIGLTNPPTISIDSSL